MCENYPFCYYNFKPDDKNSGQWLIMCKAILSVLPSVPNNKPRFKITEFRS